MPNVKVFDMTGKEVSKLDLAETIFGITPNEQAMHLCVVNYLAHQRQGTQSALTRSERRGGGAKPWRQKGTGRARQGSTRAPQWIKGGVVFAPKPREYGFSINKKVRRLAMKSALTSKVLNDEFTVVDQLKFDEIKTQAMAKVLSDLNAGKKVLVVLPEKDEAVYKSTRNIEGAKVSFVNTLNVYDILHCDTMLVVKDAVAKIEEVYA